MMNDRKERVAKALANTCHKALSQLSGEGLMVDAVAMVVSATNDNGDTVFFQAKEGNLHAAIGAMREAVASQDSYEHGYNQARGAADFNS